MSRHTSASTSSSCKERSISHSHPDSGESLTVSTTLCSSCAANVLPSCNCNHCMGMINHSNETIPFLNPNCFQTVVIPATNLNPSAILFEMRRRDKTVTFQWEEFSGTVGNNGASYVSIRQSFPGLPQKRVVHIIPLIFNGRSQFGLFVVDPSQPDPIRFFFSDDMSGAGITTNDTFIFLGSCVTWIAQR